MANECMLTTIDNPFDPFEQFTSWFLFDVEKGYNTCSYLARIAKLSNGMTQKEEDDEVERAIDEIVSINPLGIYMKVRRKKTNSDINSDSNEVIHSDDDETKADQTDIEAAEETNT